LGSDSTAIRTWHCKKPIRAMKTNNERESKEAFLIESLKALVDGLAETFGPRCEVVLHDLRSPRNLKRSIVRIANGHATGRKVGGPITDQGLRDIRSGRKESVLINYPSVTKNGRALKSSSIIFRDREERPITALCINFDVTDIIAFNAAVQDVFKVVDETTQRSADVETFQNDAFSTLNEMAEKAIKGSGKAAPSMVRADKIEIVRQLEEKGFFLIKGAVKLIASKLNVSKYTIYNYLEQLRSNQQAQRL